MTDKVLFQKVSQILNLVRQIRAVLSNLDEELPEVDFIVDRFDRNGSNGLGHYWINRGAFSVINGIGAVPVAGGWHVLEDTTGLNTRCNHQFIYDEFYMQASNEHQSNRGHSGGQLARYKARLSSDNFTAEIKFTVFPVRYAYTSGGYTYYNSVAQLVSIASSFDQDDLGGIVATSLIKHLYYEGGSGIVDELIDLSGLRTFIASSDGANLSLNTTAFMQRDGNWYSTGATAAVIGENTLRLTVSGNTVTVTLNGVVCAVESTGSFARGRMVGMLALQAVGLYASGMGFSVPPAVTSFKVWAEGTTEPAITESGHGVDDGGLQYTDGYHDEDGVYNPLAFE